MHQWSNLIIAAVHVVVAIRPNPNVHNRKSINIWILVVNDGGMHPNMSIELERIANRCNFSLPRRNMNETPLVISDPYVKIWQLVRGKRIDKKKTITVKNCLNPNFDEIFTFASPMNTLRETQFEISVMDRDVIGRNEVIGKVTDSTYTGKMSRTFWVVHTQICRAVWHALSQTPRVGGMVVTYSPSTCAPACHAHGMIDF